MKFSTVSSDERLHFGTIICCIGVRYKSYCSNICRTVFVEPSQVLRGCGLIVEHTLNVLYMQARINEQDYPYIIPCREQPAMHADTAHHTCIYIYMYVRMYRIVPR